MRDELRADPVDRNCIRVWRRGRRRASLRHNLERGCATGSKRHVGRGGSNIADAGRVVREMGTGRDAGASLTVDVTELDEVDV